jgi:hypothetical protein
MEMVGFVPFCMPSPTLWPTPFADRPGRAAEALPWPVRADFAVVINRCHSPAAGEGRYQWFAHVGTGLDIGACCSA